MVVDYGVNDPLFTATHASQRQYLGMMRAATEQLVRRLLLRAEQRGEESFALLYLAMQRSWENASYAFADEVYSPVCAAYGVPVVSVRDALWPDVALPVTHAQARLWQTKNGAHPSWHGHQLVADLLALTLAHADHLDKIDQEQGGGGGGGVGGSGSGGGGSSGSSSGSSSGGRSLVVTGTSERFRSDGAAALDTCAEGRFLSPPAGASGFLGLSRPAGRGWGWVDHDGKVGWEYDARNDERSRRPSAPARILRSSATSSVTSSATSSVVAEAQRVRRLRSARRSANAYARMSHGGGGGPGGGGGGTTVVWGQPGGNASSLRGYAAAAATAGTAGHTDTAAQPTPVAAPVAAPAAVDPEAPPPLPTLPAAYNASLPGILSLKATFNASGSPGVLVRGTGATRNTNKQTNKQRHLQTVQRFPGSGPLFLVSPFVFLTAIAVHPPV